MSTHEIIETHQAPSAIGTYSQAVKKGPWVFVSGQIGLHPETLQMQEGCAAQAEQVFKNLKAVVEASGAKLEDVVKLTVYLLDMADFGTLNMTMEKYFTAPYPARAAVAVTGLPKNAMIEIDAIVVQ